MCWRGLTRLASALSAGQDFASWRPASHRSLGLFAPVRVSRRVFLCTRVSWPGSLSPVGESPDPQTLLKCYQRPDEATMREALAGRGRLQQSGEPGTNRHHPPSSSEKDTPPSVVTPSWGCPSFEWARVDWRGRRRQAPSYMNAARRARGVNLHHRHHAYQAWRIPPKSRHLAVISG
jgi:hypothetical protein